jgi:hypothetical protein
VLTATEVWDEAALAALIAGATLLGVDLKAGLLTNTPVISKKLTIADLVEPGYASYARQLVVMGPVMRDPVNGIASIAAGLTWQETGAVTAVTITGIFYTFGAGPALLGVEMFATPISLTDLIDAFVTVLEYIQSSDNQGFSTIIR